MTFDIRPATVADLDVAALTLASAFENYVWTRWSIPEDGYVGRLENLQRLYLGYALELGIVLVDESLNGVIALLSPDATPPSVDLQNQIAILHGSRLDAVMQVNTPPQPEGAWNLATLGVHQGLQGQGLGAALVNAALAEVDKFGGANVVGRRKNHHQVPIALETSDGANVHFYERLGFEIAAVTEIADGPASYSMHRI